MIIRGVFVTSAFILLNACATVGSYQDACEQQYAAFPDVVVCLKAKLSADWRPAARDSRVKLYLLKADQLSQMVQKGEMSEINARVALQELYVKLKQDANAEERAARPLQTNCSEFLGEIRCTTQ